MEPVFNKNSSLVGWLKPDSGNVFDTRMRFVAFVRGNAYSLFVAGI